MEIEFKYTKDYKIISSKEKEIKKHYGTNAEKIMQRFCELRAAENLGVIKSIQSLKFHRLIGDRKGQYSISIKDNFRITFLPVDVTPKDDSELELVKKIQIIDINIDYH